MRQLFQLHTTSVCYPRLAGLLRSFGLPPIAVGRIHVNGLTAAVVCSPRRT
jgi:hypothetical protein